MKKISVIGAGYVGLSLATMLSVKNMVTIVDVDEHKLQLIDKRITPIYDAEMEKFFKNKRLYLKTSVKMQEAVKGADIVIIALPTNIIEESGNLCTKEIDEVIEKISMSSSEIVIVIKSTVPVGYLYSLREKKYPNIILYSPEFMRESKALWDNLNPNRIVIGVDKSNQKSIEYANLYNELIKESANKKNYELLIMGYIEAEATKLFSNAYLAMRVAFFNELDNFAILNHVNCEDIIKAVCLDPRIGMYYNNPSFGYGGYCLPKDLKQLINCYGEGAEQLFTATEKSNRMRKRLVVGDIAKTIGEGEIIGLYKLSMKKGSDNCRNSASIDVLEGLIKLYGENRIIVFDEKCNLPISKEKKLLFIADINKFKRLSNIIIANRMDDELEDVKEKVYTRDIFARD